MTANTFSNGQKLKQLPNNLSPGVMFITYDSSLNTETYHLILKAEPFKSNVLKRNQTITYTKYTSDQTITYTTYTSESFTSSFFANSSYVNPMTGEIIYFILIDNAFRDNMQVNT